MAALKIGHCRDSDSSGRLGTDMMEHEACVRTLFSLQTIACRNVTGHEFSRGSRRNCYEDYLEDTYEHGCREPKQILLVSEPLMERLREV